ncbi:MAG: galactose ABC transporter substrate-binding protein [Spirochaetaceae bacterium]|jgi:methyl-galactoside transport system substrate-binding protein|nr:galactose ABC transporter substrate-binding protein [Spirochaetaceae bacterium]
MKPWIILFAAFMLFNCQGNKQQVFLLAYNLEDPYLAGFVERIGDKAQGLFTLHIYDVQNSQLVQNQILEDILREDPALILFNPVDRLASYAIIEKLKQRNIPVIFFNREPLHQDMEIWDRTYYVGARAEQSARLQADLAISLFQADQTTMNHLDRNGDGVIQAVILKGEQGHQDAETRTNQVILTFQERDIPLEVLTILPGNWDSAGAYEKTDALLEEFGSRMELVLSNNDAMAVGMIRRMRQQGWFQDSNGNGQIDPDDSSWIPLLGIDGIDDAIDLIEQGYLYSTVWNDSDTMAEALVELSQALLLGQSLDNLSFILEEDQYIWIDYQPFHLD